MKKMMLMILFSLLTNACSPVNSMAPFDDQQAAIVARSMMPNVTSVKATPAHD